jgi:hypothetical protein
MKGKGWMFLWRSLEGIERWLCLRCRQEIFVIGKHREELDENWTCLVTSPR